RSIYEQLGRAASRRSRDVLLARAEELVPSERYCRYSLARAQGKGTAAADAATAGGAAAGPLPPQNGAPLGAPRSGRRGAGGPGGGGGGGGGGAPRGRGAAARLRRVLAPHGAGCAQREAAPRAGGGGGARDAPRRRRRVARVDGRRGAVRRADGQRVGVPGR